MSEIQLDRTCNPVSFGSVHTYVVVSMFVIYVTITQCIHPPSRSRHPKRRQLYQTMVFSIERSRKRKQKNSSDSSPNPSIFSFPTPTAYSVPPNPTANLAPVAQGSREETGYCTARDQRRDAVERIGCDNTMSRRGARTIYHGVAISKHHRSFRLRGELWHGVEVHRRKDTV